MITPRCFFAVLVCLPCLFLVDALRMDRFADGTVDCTSSVTQFTSPLTAQQAAILLASPVANSKFVFLPTGNSALSADFPLPNPCSDSLFFQRALTVPDRLHTVAEVALTDALRPFRFLTSFVPHFTFPHPM